MRYGFSLITAIIFMILVATLGALALSLSTQTVKQTSDLYLREQAELLLQSGTEYALLALSGHNIVDTNSCINAIHINYPTTGSGALFDINISIAYLGQGLPSSCNLLDNTLQTPESNLTVIIDTIVQTTLENNISTEPIRLHRRTIQKP